jgi:twitching motility protein PilT
MIQLSSRDGMQTLDEALAKLVKSRMVTLEEALLRTSNQMRLKRLLGFEVDALVL